MPLGPKLQYCTPSIACEAQRQLFCGAGGSDERWGGGDGGDGGVDGGGIVGGKGGFGGIILKLVSYAAQ